MDRESLIGALAAVEHEVAEFFGSLDAGEFTARDGHAWSPAEHLAHLCIAVNAVARGLAMPRWLLRLRFGRSRAGSRTFEQLRDDYRARLAAGGRASGRYIPPVATEAVDRNGLLGRWARANQRLREALGPWPESDLEIRLPHPILGRITTREMLFFTVYHGSHHVAAAKRRLARFVD